MLDINIRIDGDKVLIEGLQDLAGKGIPQAIEKGLNRIGPGVEREADYWLAGKGGASKKVRKDYVGFTKKSGEAVMFRSYEGAGAYPIPVRTANLRGHLDWLKPGASKTGPSGTFTAGPNEVVIYDSAEYADAVFHGKGSSAKYGERDALKDGLDRFNQGNRIVGIMEEEIQKAVKGE